MALIGELITFDSRESLRNAITDEAAALVKRFGLTSQELSIIATRMMVTVEAVEVEKEDE